MTEHRDEMEVALPLWVPDMGGEPIRGGGLHLPLVLVARLDGSFTIIDRGQMISPPALATYESLWADDHAAEGGMIYSVEVVWQRPDLPDQACPSEWNCQHMVLADNPLEALRLARLGEPARHAEWLPTYSLRTRPIPNTGVGVRPAHVYRGLRCGNVGVYVTANGRKLDHERSCKVWNHSPTGPEWGYGGSGPAQLALMLLLHEGLSDETATRLHQRLKSDIVARLPKDAWRLDSWQLLEWFQQYAQR